MFEFGIAGCIYLNKLEKSLLSESKAWNEDQECLTVHRRRPTRRVKIQRSSVTANQANMRDGLCCLRLRTCFQRQRKV